MYFFNLPNKFKVNRMNVFQTLQYNFYINYVKPRRDPLKTGFKRPWNILLGNYVGHYPLYQGLAIYREVTFVNVTSVAENTE